MPNSDWAGRPVLASIVNRSSFLVGDLLLGKLSKTVVVRGYAPHDRPRPFVSHLIGNRASLLCTKAPMLRIPYELSGWHSQDLKAAGSPPAENATACQDQAGTLTKMSTGAPRAAPATGASFCLTPSEILALASQPNGVCATRWEGALGASQKAAPHIVSPLVPRALAPGL
jgi:hypothetical protein